MDWFGMGLLGTGIAGLQYMFDRGNSQDWFSATDIKIATVLGVVGVAGFTWWSFERGPRAVFDIRIFRDRNFGMACLVIMALGLGMFGGLVMQPILLAKRVDPRVLVATGMMVSAAGSYAMTFYSLDINTFWIVWPALLQGLGLGLIFVPLSTIAYATLEPSRMAEAAGLYSLVRTIGAAVGISIVTTLMAREAQIIWNELGAHITPFSQAVMEYLRPLHLSPRDPRAMALIARQIAEQAQITAMLDVFKRTAWSFVLMLPLVLLLRRSRGGAAASAPAVAME